MNVRSFFLSINAVPGLVNCRGLFTFVDGNSLFSTAIIYLSRPRPHPPCFSYGSRTRSLLALGRRGYLIRIRNDGIVDTWNAENGFPSGFLLTCWKRLNSLLKRMHAPSMERSSGYRRI